MTQPILAAQLYTVRQFTQTDDELAESMAKIRVIGYQAVQISAIGPISPSVVKKIMDANGLVICITHISYEQLWHHLDEVIDLHRLWNCQNVAIGSMPQEYRTGENGFRRFATEASQVGERLAQAGLTFSYHNHSFEFVRYGNRTGLDILYEESDPRFLQAELDTYWIQHGGGDPSAWIRRMKNRMPVIHLKDMAVTLENGTALPEMAEIGEGNLNWPGILAACQEANVAWYAIEQDICKRDPFESLEISYNNLKAMGLS
jgi:sugar phosphate isomerase/epimerase